MSAGGGGGGGTIGKRYRMSRGCSHHVCMHVNLT